MDAQETRLNAGRVQLCIGGHWTDICSSTWHNNDRRVACRQVNNENASKLTTILCWHDYFYSRFFTLAVTERNPSPTATANVIQAVVCLGYEESLAECPIFVTSAGCSISTSLAMNCPLKGI